jgi:hypothetical protein
MPIPRISAAKPSPSESGEKQSMMLLAADRRQRAKEKDEEGPQTARRRE